MAKGKFPVWLAAIIVVGLVIGAGYIAWKSIGVAIVGSEPTQVVVKPANPDDPKYKPDPKLGLGGGQ